MKILFMSDIHVIKRNLMYIEELEKKENFNRSGVLVYEHYPFIEKNDKQYILAKCK